MVCVLARCVVQVPQPGVVMLGAMAVDTIGRPEAGKIHTMSLRYSMPSPWWQWAHL